MNQPIQTPAYWDQTADGYIASAEPFTARFCEDAVQLAGVEPGATLLDIATGPGALALAAQRAGAQVTAIDFSQTMIDRLTARAEQTGLVALRMDGQALDLPTGHFDCVCSVFGIPLFPDWRKGIAEMARVLRPGGIALLGVAGNPDGFGPNQLFAAARARCLPGLPVDHGLPGMALLCTADRVTAELHDAGLENVVIHSRTHDFILPAGLLESDSPMITAHPFILGLDDAQREAVIAEAKRLSETWRVGDTIRIPGTANIAVASKPNGT
jgi:SAM-dependent methyltransferase